MEPSKFEVVVGNMGKLYEGPTEARALQVYDIYVKQSQAGKGRAGNETVTLFKDEDVVKEFVPAAEALKAANYGGYIVQTKKAEFVWEDHTLYGDLRRARKHKTALEAQGATVRILRQVAD